MLTETTAPSLLFITSPVSLILIAFQVSHLHKSGWDIYNVQSIRRLLALCTMLFIIFLSALSGILGLVAYQAGRTGDRSRAARADVGGKIIVVILQSGRKSIHMSSSRLRIYSQSHSSLGVHDVSSESESSGSAYTLAVHWTFWKSEDSHNCDVLPTRSKYVVSLPIRVIHVSHTGCIRYCSFHCFCGTPRRLPSRAFSGALLASLFYTPVLCHHPPLLIYPPRGRVLDHRTYVACPRSRTCLWRSVHYLCTCWKRGFSGAYFPFRRVLDHMCNVCTSSCVIPSPGLHLAYHPSAVHSILPDPYPSPLLSGLTSSRRGVSPRALVNAPRPSNAGSVRLHQPAITLSAEDFRNLQDPFASPSSPLTEKPFPLFEAARMEQARKKSLSITLAATRHSSPADLVLPQKFLQSFEVDTPPPSPPANALVRAPRHASYSGALRA